MGAFFNTVKGFVFVFNIICVIIDVANLVIDGLGVKYSAPGSDGHAFFILGILLCGLLIMTTVIGCYGVCSEILGVNVIYSIFMLSLLIIEYLEIRSFQPHGIYFHTLQSLETAWRVVGINPEPMDDIQRRLHCCGLFSGQDYAFKHMSIPDSCLSVEGSSVTTHQIGCLDAHWKSHINMTRRQQCFYWALLAAESFTLLYSIVFCVLIHRRRHHRSANNLDDVREVIIQQNNIGSRQRLL
ncbi:protein late bloomer [Musca domestica]|uniref:Protein late bloomer n=1 Tax=Musca domestica TaxID=7370 RepID=A0A1I8M6K9_MUSDO|nr:protein late bloomer [Musca domestica]